MSKQPFLPLFFGDLLASTAAWDGEERALYVLLLAYQWTSGPLPADPKRVAKMAQYDTKTFLRLWAVVGTKFPQGPDGLANPRLEEHRAKSQQLASKRAEIGRRGGEASGQARAKQSPTKSEANASGLLEQKRTIHPIPSHPTDKSLSQQSDRTYSESGNARAKESVSRETFIAIQSKYPAGIYAQSDWILAERTIGNLLEHEPAEKLIEAASGYAEQQRATGGIGTQFIMNPAKFYATAKWRGPFPLPKTKAEATQDANVSASLEWLRQEETGNAA